MRTFNPSSQSPYLWISDCFKSILKSLKTFPFILVLSLISISCCGQDFFAKSIDFLPPAPNAATLIKNEVLSLNKNTGSVNVQIPLHELNGKKLKVPVSLSYVSNGIRVDEMASRSGMGWSLACGGVITRTIKGSPDEIATRISPWATIDYNWSTYNFMKAVSDNDGNSNLDAEPDLFSFSFPGGSGSFIFNKNMQPVLLVSSNLKIEYNFYAADWNFKITDGNGITYFFGGSSATEKSKRTATYGKPFAIYRPTSWYLKKIQHPDGEQINFTYEPIQYTNYDSIVETMDNYVSCNGAGAVTDTYKNRNYTTTDGVLLKTVESDGYAGIRFYYQNRPDGNDQLIRQFEIYNRAHNTILKKISLAYTSYTPNTNYSNSLSVNEAIPYLTSITESSADSTLTLKHKFTYYNPQNRPPRLSFSQDHYGYFNGAINSSFVPYTEYLAEKMPNAKANREPNASYSINGLLSSITYPTGATDTLVYEPNIIEATMTPWPEANLHDEVTGTGLKTQVSKQFNFSIDRDQTIDLDLSTVCNAENCDVTHQVIGTVKITDIANLELLRETLAINTSLQKKLFLAQGTYKVTLTAAGSVLTTLFNMKYKPVTLPPQTYNKVLAGLRIKSIKSMKTGNPDIIKKYYYGTLTNLNGNSTDPINDPVYVKSYTSTIYNIQTPPCEVQHIALHANSLINLFNYENNGVSYKSVIEGYGENFENGLLETKYITGKDVDAQLLRGANIYLDGTKSNFSLVYKNGKVKEENFYKKGANNNFIPLKLKSYTYKTDSRKTNEYNGYFASSNDQMNALVDTTVANSPLLRLVDGFTLKRYDLYSQWIYNDTLIEKTFDENGLNGIEQKSFNFYDNADHLQLTRTKQINSKVEELETVYTYPADYASVFPYNEMISNHKIETVIDKSTTKGATLLNKQSYIYKKLNNNTYEIDLIKRYKIGSGMEIIATIDKYDDSNNIIQYTQQDGINTTTLWGYSKTYPIVQVKNADYQTVINALGGEFNVNTFLNRPNPTTVEINNFFAPLKLALSNAQIISYTYDPLVGMTSQTDAKGQTTFYEYDNFQRLKTVKDQNGNIVKSYTYNYKN